MIDFRIAFYFSDNEAKAYELMDVVIATNRITFENKVQIFKIIIERHKPEFIQSNPKIFNLIFDLIKERNVFAHYNMFSGDSALEKYQQGVFCFVKFKNDREIIEYTREKIENIHFNFVMTAEKIRGLFF